MKSFKFFVASFILGIVLAPAMMGCKPADPIPSAPSATSNTTGDAPASNTTGE